MRCAGCGSDGGDVARGGDVQHHCVDLLAGLQHTADHAGERQPGQQPDRLDERHFHAGANQFSILGWYLFHPASLAEGGADGHQRMRVGAGTANTGSFMSYGLSGNTERALGSQVSGTTVTATPGQQYIGLRLTNNTADILTEFTLSYDGEQWRDGGATTPAAKTMTVEYSTTAATVNDTPNFTAGPASLSFTTPVFVNTGSGAAVNGNTAGKVSVGPATVQGIAWAPGTDLWIRWKDPRSSGNNHGMAIDNVSFSANVPEPASIGLLGGALALLARRKRK